MARFYTRAALNEHNLSDYTEDATEVVSATAQTRRDAANVCRGTATTSPYTAPGARDTLDEPPSTDNAATSTSSVLRPTRHELPGRRTALTMPLFPPPQ